MQMRLANRFIIPRMYQKPTDVVRRGTYQQAGILQLKDTIFRSEHCRLSVIDFRRFFRQDKPRYKFGRNHIITNY